MQNRFSARWKHPAGKFYTMWLINQTPSDYHLFASMGHTLAEQLLVPTKIYKKWFDEWLAAKRENFYWRGIHILSERLGKMYDKQMSIL